VNRTRRIANYLASDTTMSYREWVAHQDHADRLAGKLWPLGALALFVLACVAATIAVITVAIKTRQGVQ
jgi:cytochrome c oxidase assembly factor CtaG